METVLEGKNPSKNRVIPLAISGQQSEYCFMQSVIGISLRSNTELHIEDTLSLGGHKKEMDGATIKKVTLTNPL